MPNTAEGRGTISYSVANSLEWNFLPAIPCRELLTAIVPSPFEWFALDNGLGAVDSRPVGRACDESLFATLF